MLNFSYTRTPLRLAMKVCNYYLDTDPVDSTRHLLFRPFLLSYIRRDITADVAIVFDILAIFIIIMP